MYVKEDTDPIELCNTNPLKSRKKRDTKFNHT